MVNLCLGIVIGNRSELLHAYGDSYLQQVEEATLQHVLSACAELGMVAVPLGDQIRIQPCPKSHFAEEAYPDYLRYQDFESVIATLCGNLACAGDAASTALLCAAIIDTNTPDDAAEVARKAAPVALPRSVVDVSNVARVMDLIRRDAISFVFQPVISCANGASICYQEALARGHDSDGQVLKPGDFIPLFEQLHLIRLIDRHIVKRVIGMLKIDTTLTLGVNISAESAVDDLWWMSTMMELESRADVAQRLVVEVTETTPCAREGGWTFARRMQSLGCRIAIDDFGVGNSIETAIEFDTSDFIKLDRRFIANAVSGKNPGELQCVIKVARALGREVVIEGIEDERGLQLARSAGAQWVQGYYLERPLSLPIGCAA